MTNLNGYHGNCETLRILKFSVLATTLVGLTEYNCESKQPSTDPLKRT